MFWNYSKKSSQSGTLFLKVYNIYNSNGPGMFIRDVFRDVRDWMIWSWLFCFHADFLHCHNNLWVYCLPFRWVWLLQGMHVLTNWSTSGKSYFEAGLRDHCLSAHWGCKGCLKHLKPSSVAMCGPSAPEPSRIQLNFQVCASFAWRGCINHQSRLGSLP